MNHMQICYVIQARLLVMQPQDWSNLLAEMRAKAAQIHDILDSRGLKRPYNGGPHPILVGHIIPAGVIRRDHGKDTVRAAECSGEDIRIVECAGIGNGSLTHQAFQAFGTPPDCMDPTTGC